MAPLTFDLSRSACSEALHVRCAGCGGQSCVGAVGLAFADENFHWGPPYAFIATGRCAGLTDDEAAAAALEALDEALEAGPVAELAPSEARTVDGPMLWRHALTRMGIDPTEPATRDSLRALTAAALTEARSIVPICDSED